MEATRKRQLKRRSKTLMWLAYGCVAFFILFLTTTLIIRSHSTGDWTAPIIMIPILAGLILPLFLGMSLGMYSGLCRSELLRYKRDIQTYRARWFAIRAIEHLQDGEVQQAVNEYIKCNWYPDKSLDDYVYGMIIMACHLSKDEKLHKQGLHRINEVKKRFDPAKVTL